MDTTKITKQQLVEEIEKITKENEQIKKEILEQGDVKATVKLKDDAIKGEHQARQENKILQERIANLEKEKNGLISKINELATLLEEYVVSFEDQQKIFSVVLKNNNYIQSALRQKIEIFNKGD